MSCRAQFARTRRIIRSFVQIPEMGFAQRAQCPLLRRQIDYVLVLAIYYTDHAVPQRLEDAVPFQVFAECKSFPFCRGAFFQPLRKRLATHAPGLELAGQFEDGRCKRGLVRRDGDFLPLVLTWQADDEGNVNDGPGEVRSAVLINTPLKAFPVVG